MPGVCRTALQLQVPHRQSSNPCVVPQDARQQACQIIRSPTPPEKNGCLSSRLLGIGHAPMAGPRPGTITGNPEQIEKKDLLSKVAVGDFQILEHEGRLYEEPGHIPPSGGRAAIGGRNIIGRASAWHVLDLSCAGAS